MNVRPFALAALAGCALSAHAQVTGPSTLQSPYMLPSNPSAGVVFTSIASNGNGIIAPNETYPRLGGGAPYRLVGLPDGMGAIRTPDDIANGTFTLVCNHEANANQGVARAHGSRGAFVSQWTIRTNVGAPNHLEVIGGKDLGLTAKLWRISSGAYETYNAAMPMPTYGPGNTLGTTPDPSLNGFARFCSGDTPAASALKFGTLGTDDRIHLCGEENGANGRAFANIITGPEAGVVYELPRLGDYSWENAVASPFPQEKTVIVGLDDSTPGNIYVYIGTKQSTGSPIERAGLTNGSKYGIVIAGVTVNGSGQPVESPAFGLGASGTGASFSKPFTMYDFGDVTAMTGGQLQSVGDANGVMNWLRPEDGAWDPADPSRFYFVTTDSFGGNSRIWVLDFTDIENPELGGQAAMLFDGSVFASASGGWLTSGLTDVRMMDNFCTTHNNQLLIQEDVGNNPRLGRLWMYDIDQDRIVEVGVPDATRYLMGGAQFMTQDEETSGIIDAWDIIGPGWFLLNMQGHFGISGELVESGQLMAVYIPQTIPGVDCFANCDNSTIDPVLSVADFACFLNRFAAGNTFANCDGSTVAPVLNVLDFACFLNQFAAGCS
jgi:hypothetical protein